MELKKISLSGSLLLVVQKCDKFLYIDFVLWNFTKIVY